MARLYNTRPKTERALDPIAKLAMVFARAERIEVTPVTTPDGGTMWVFCSRDGRPLFTACTTAETKVDHFRRQLNYQLDCEGKNGSL